MSDVVNAIELRLARPSDLAAIQRLCYECFPVRYPDMWFSELVSTVRYLTILACIRPVNSCESDVDKIVVGLIVAEYRSLSCCKVTDRTIIHPRLAADSVVMYILSLAVTSQYRRFGIGSLLLFVVLEHAKRQTLFFSPSSDVGVDDLQYALSESDVSMHLTPHQAEFVQWICQHHHRTSAPCRAVYLHTECTNRTALRFYRQRGFCLHHLVPRCYLIQGRPADGFCCVFHCNGGYSHRSLAYHFRLLFSASYPDVCSPLAHSSQECLLWLRRHFCAVRAATVALIGQVVLRLRGAVSALQTPFSFRQRPISKVSKILLWWHPSASPSPDAPTTPVLIHSL